MYSTGGVDRGWLLRISTIAARYSVSALCFGSGVVVPYRASILRIRFITLLNMLGRYP